MSNDEDKNSFYHKRNKIVESFITDIYGKNVIIYDFFIRNKKIYFVSSFWSPVQPAFRIRIKGIKISEFGINEQEPVRYFSGIVGSLKKFDIFINGNLYLIEPTVIQPIIKKHRFAITTLFKYETIAMVLRFITYYRNQGCTMFYLYFNGSEIPKDMPIGPDIHYCTWDFPYYLVDTAYIHCAQSVYLTTVKLRYLDDCQFLALIDMDEFIFSIDQSVKIVDYIESVDCDIIKIANHWAKCPDTGGPITYSAIGSGFLNRTKCIYRHGFKGHFAIHEPKKQDKYKIYNSPDLLLLHVVTLHKERSEFIKEPILTTDITLSAI